MKKYDAIVIGGSAGSFQIVADILGALPKNFGIPVILCLHRLKHVRGGFVEAFSGRSSIPVVEPKDKDSILPGFVYLAPANYHLYVEQGNYFSLSVEEPENHSRPSIDLTFFSVALTYKERVLGIILSGANKDGARGAKTIKDFGGEIIVQDPNSSEFAFMPKATIVNAKVDHIFNVKDLVNYVSSI